MVDEKNQNAELVLQGLYDAYASLSGERRGLACGPGCNACCTDRVLLTGLEARRMARGLKDSGQDLLLDEARDLADQGGAVMTFNAWARHCLAGEEPPEEPRPAAEEPGRCPLLVDGLCAVYEDRPFACRSMASLQPCLEGGQALDTPWWVTLNTAFFQLVEQASAGMRFGPLARMLCPDRGESSGLPVCENLPGIPAPEQHQERLAKVLRQVFSREIDGMNLGQRMQGFRVSGPA